MTSPEQFDVLGGTSVESREARLTDGIDQLSRRSSFLTNKRFLIRLSAVLVTLGLSVILLGWIGAARSTHTEEQIPYLISGGLFGLAIALIGAASLLAHWVTVLIREERTREVTRRKDHEELLAAVRSLAAPNSDHEQESANGRARGTRPQRQVRRAPRR